MIAEPGAICCLQCTQLSGGPACPGGIACISYFLRKGQLNRHTRYCTDQPLPHETQDRRALSPLISYPYHRRNRCEQANGLRMLGRSSHPEPLIRCGSRPRHQVFQAGRRWVPPLATCIRCHLACVFTYILTCNRATAGSTLTPSQFNWSCDELQWH